MAALPLGQRSRRRQSRLNSASLGWRPMADMCVIRQSGIPLDARGTREIEALVAAGHDVDVICLRVPGQPLRERDGRLTIYRVPLERKRRGVLRYLFEYAAFFVAAGGLRHGPHPRPPAVRR